MLTLSFDQLFFRIKSKNIPAQYTLKSPETIKHSRFFDALYSFCTTEELLYFIEKVCSAKNISLKSRQYTYIIDGLSDFLCHFFDAGFYKTELTEEQNLAVEALLNKVIFSKDQLISLLQRGSPDDIEYLLKNYLCFSKNDLLEIVNEVEIVKWLHLKTIGILYFYFNPLGQETYATPLLDMYYYSYRVGHILGLNKGVCFEHQGIQFQIDSEGEFASTSLGHLADYIQSYYEAHPSPLVAKILAAFKLSYSLITPNHNYYQEVAELTFFNKFCSNELVYFSSGWSGHTIGLALYGDYLVYTNRGEGGAKDGCRIFKIKNRKLVTPELIKSLLSFNYNSAAEFHEALSQIVNLWAPVMSFKSKKQKYDTCSFVNPKAIFEALIVLLQLQPTARVEELKVQSNLEKDRSKYKAFTEFVRKTEIHKLTKRMTFAKNPVLIAFYAALVKEIIYQHYGQDLEREKDVKEFDRAAYLYENTPTLVKSIMETDKDFMCFIEDIMLVPKPAPKPVVFSQPPSRIEFITCEILQQPRKVITV